MKQLKLERVKEELISTGGNYLCGQFPKEPGRLDQAIECDEPLLFKAFIGA